MKAALAILLALSTVASAATTTDPLRYLLSAYVLSADEKAVAAVGEGVVDAKGLAGLQSDLMLIAEGLESFRDEAQVKDALVSLESRMSPELKPFFKNRASSLDAIYRTLAVTDYTWAGRFPEPPCEPAAKRLNLLSSRDGLFQTDKGEASPWLVALLGPQAVGQSAAQALDLASSQSALSAAEYEKRRSIVKRLTLALASEKAVGAARSKLYCSRAAAFADLAAYQRVAHAVPAFEAEKSVFVLHRNDRRGAAVFIKTKNGPVIVTDAALLEGTEQVELLARLDNGATVAFSASVDRRDANMGLAVLVSTEPLKRPVLMLAESGPEKDELVYSVGHPEASGSWTRTSGIVVKVGANGFQTDAAIALEFAGGPVLNTNGELTGLLVSRPVTSDTGTQRWPVAIPAAAIMRWLSDTGEVPAPVVEPLEDMGTAAILSRAQLEPLAYAARSNWLLPEAPPPVTASVRGVCVRYCDIPRQPAPAYSGGSSYSGSGGAAMGQALGEAMAPLVKMAVFEGIPALFRGLGSLFKGSPRSSPSMTKSAPPPPVKAPPPPKPEPLKPTAIKLQVSDDNPQEGGEVTLTATVEFSGVEGSKAGIPITFSALPADKIEFTGGASASTDGAGNASAVALLKADEAAQAFDAIDGRKAARARVSKPDAKRKVKDAAAGAVDALEAEELKYADDETGEQSDAQAGATPQSSASSVRAVVKVTASGAGFSDTKAINVMTGPCPSGLVAVMPAMDPPGGSPPTPTRIDPKKAKELFECQQIEARIEAKCGGDLACDERELRSEQYFEKGCESRWRKIEGVVPGSSGSPNITKRKNGYWCRESSAKMPTITAPQPPIHQPMAAGDGEGDDDEANDVISSEDRSKQTRPTNAPPGTIGLDRSGLSRELIHRIKKLLRAKPKDWTGITVDKQIVTTGGDGLVIYHGHLSDYSFGD